MLPGALVAGRFVVETVAGVGGMGTVWRARDQVSGRQVALKIFTGSKRQGDRFDREARVLADLGHRGIVEHIDHGTEPGGHAYLAMEWLEGQDLGERIAQGPLAVDEALALVLHVAEALNVAHARGVVHRDVKPANIFLVGGALDHPKILDFGIARILGDAHVTRAGEMLGTPAYMAPEQARGSGEIDARTDVFALGCVLFECLSGKPPFWAEHPLGVMAKILLDEPAKLTSLRAEVPKEVELLVGRMLAKNPVDRPLDAGVVADALRVLAMPTAVRSVAAPSVLPPKAASQSLTARERQLLCVLFVGRVAIGDETTGEGAATTVTADPSGDVDKVCAEAMRYGGWAERFVDGSLVITLPGQGAALDQAAVAARCALAVRRAMPVHPMALVTGRADISGGLPVGDVIDRGVGLLDAELRRPPQVDARVGIAIDDVTAGLLDRRFDIVSAAHGLALVGEREGHLVGGTLLGKPQPFVGRSDEMERLVQEYEACGRERRARAVLITAAPGMGKTRLLREVLHKIELLGAGRAPAQVVLGRAEATRKTVSLGLVTSALHSAFGMLEGEDQPAWRHRVRVRVKRSVAKEELDRVAVFLGELVGAPFPDQAHPLLAAARADSIRMGDQIRRAWEDWLEAEARRAPIVLAFEDVQWADPPSVRFIEAAARNLAHLPVLIIALARPEVDGLFPGLLGAANATRIELGPLSPESCSALVRAALGNAIEEAAVQRIVQHSDGNAFHLEELIRAVSEGRSAKLPETVMAMVEARLDALDPEARRALRAAAVIGPTFTAGAMATLLGNPDAAALRGWIAELARRELVVSRGFSTATGEPELAFRSALVREAAYAMLTEEDRALGHRLAAAWVQKNGRPRDAIVVAEHLERGGEPASASSWFARAAELALESNDFAEAVSCAQRGRATTTDEAARGTLLVVQAEAHRHLGDNPGMLARSIEAMATLRRGDRAWWSAAADAVLGAIRMGKKDDLDRLCSEMRGFSGQLPAAAARIGHYLHFAGRHDVATELLHQVAAIDDPTDPGRWAWMHRAHATRGLVTGDVGSYLEHLQHAVKAFDLAGDVRDPASERVNVGFAQAELGLYDDAEVTLRAALGTAERLGLLHVVAAAQQNLASVLYRLGRMEESKTILLLAIATFAAQGNKRMEGNSRVYLARILLLERDLVEAQKEALHGAQLLSAVRPLLPMAVATSALVFLMSGRKEEARLLASDALDALVAVGHLDEGESFVRLTHAEALAAVGDRDAANESIGIARSRLLERAAAIRNLVWKESFLENVFENARTLALAHAWLGN